MIQNMITPSTLGMVGACQQSFVYLYSILRHPGAFLPPAAL